MLEIDDLLHRGRWLLHEPFGVGMVLQIEPTPFVSGETAVLVNFDLEGKKWVFCRVAWLRYLPESELSARQKAESAEVIHARERILYPATEVQPLTQLEVAVKPLTAVQIDAFKSRAWKQTLQKRDKRHRLRYRLEKGLRIFPLVTSKALPWITHASLILPTAGVRKIPGYAGRFRAGTSRGQPTVHEPRVIVASTPSCKKLRSVLYDVVQGFGGMADLVRLDIMANAATLDSSQQQVFELLEPVEKTACRSGTKILINNMRERAKNSIQSLRASAHANGRWWPAPESIQIILKGDRCVFARMRFTSGYQSPDKPWIEWPAQSFEAA